MAKSRSTVARLVIITAVTSFSIATMATTYVVPAQSYDPMCAGSSSTTTATTTNSFYPYHCACDTQALPSWYASEVQGDVLDFLKAMFHNQYYSSTSQSRYCDQGGKYGVNGTYIELFSYASCGGGNDRGQCDECLKGASQTIRDRCDGSGGVRVWSEACCARYEQYSFC